MITIEERMRKVTVHDYESLLKVLEESKGDFPKAVVLFTGSKDEAGVSWCPDCNVADPILSRCLDNYEAQLPDDAAKTVFVTAYVGERNV